ncbi:MAG TPA: hypothetical protein VH302_16820 [Bryobacteraceae bacterium]|nr:hypothetical protein [Bryobacteraceae bacterium]
MFTAVSAFAQNPSTPEPQEPPHQPTSTGQPNNAPAAPAGTTEAKQPGVLAPGKTDQGEDKYIFGVLPNYRTAEMDAIGHPLTAKRKILIATKDSFAYPLVFIGAAYAALYQYDDSHPEFGQGVAGYVRRFATSYSDQVIGNFMTEGIYPSLLHQDPRYFRMAHGSVKGRAWYAISRIVLTKSDAGHTQINFSELIGNGTATAIGLSYYPDDRDAGDFLQNWATQLGTDALSQIGKEFWPDIKRWLRHKRGTEAPMSEVPPSNRP